MKSISKKIIGLAVVTSIFAALTIGSSAATIKDNSVTSISASSTITGSKAVKIIKGLFADGTIEEPAPNYEVQYWDTTTLNNKKYYVIRIAYIDPYEPNMTETLARYLVSDTGKTVYEQDLFTFELTQIL